MCVMNISLTWANYALITGVCLAGYYIVIGLIYYRKDLIRLLHSTAKNRLPVIAKGKLVAAENAGAPDMIFPDHQTPEEVPAFDDEPKASHPNVQDFIDEIEAYTLACNRNS